MKVPLLVTVDVEHAPDHDADQQAAALLDLGRHLGDWGMPSTFFTTGHAATRYADALGELQDRGMEIGCHGLHHGPDEDYRRLTPAVASRLIDEASAMVGSVCARPRSFRAPGMAASPAAQGALVEAGYRSDFSVCPQRVDFGNSPGAAPAGLLAPRRPYRPAVGSPFRRGDRPIWVVPLSGLGVPLLSGVLYAAPPAAIRVLLRVLRWEASASGGAVVFLCHSYELADRLPGTRPKLSQRRYVRSAAERRRRLLGFLRHLATDPALAPMTAAHLVDHLDRTGAA